jgi:hypothetical protein
MSMAAGDPHAEAFGDEELTDFVEAQIRIRFTAQQLFENFLKTHWLLGKR